MTTLPPPRRGRPPLPPHPPASREFCDRLRKWPHVLEKVGPECNILLALLGDGPLYQSEMRAKGLQPRLGILIYPHGLAELVSRGVNPRYQITERGREYLTLLRHHGFLTND